MPLDRRRSLITAYYMILVSVGALTAIGLIMTMSANSITAIAADVNPYGKGLEQGLYALVGVGIALVFAHLPAGRVWQVVAWGSLIVCFGLQAATLIWGKDLYGNQNWLTIGPVTLQPSEFLKFGLAIWLGSVLAFKKNLLTSWTDLIVPALIGIALALGLVLAGRDAGTAFVMAIMAMGALVLAGVPWSKLATIAVTFAVMAGLVVASSGARRQRISLVLNPDSCADPLGSCWQSRQAEYSLAQGGILGNGLGASRAKWGSLTQADSDFIYAIIGEELGLLGAVTVLALFAVLGYALMQVVRFHPDRFCQISVGAIGCWIIGQALVNIGMVIKILPVIGVPLPFVSAGGSSLIACLAAIGAVLGLMRSNPEVKAAMKLRPRAARRTAGVFDVRGGVA